MAIGTSSSHLTGLVSAYPFRLFPRVITVSLGTMKIVLALS